MEHCEHCKKTADILFPCAKEECPVAKAKPALNPAAAWPFPKKRHSGDKSE